MDSNKTFKIVSVAFFFAIFLYFLCINVLTPVSSDDFHFQIHASGFWDFIIQLGERIKYFYLAWTGRVTTVALSLVLLSHISLFNVLNPLLFCLLLYGIFLNALLRPARRFYDLVTILLILFVLWFFVPELAETVFWKTGSICYLWSTTLCLYFLYPFLVLLFKQEDIVANRSIRIVLLSIGGAVLGSIHEDLSICVGVFLFFSNVYCYYRDKKIPSWSLLSTIIFFISLLILVLAPGNYRREKVMHIYYPFFVKLHILSSVILGHFTTFSLSIPVFMLMLVAIVCLALEKFSKLTAVKIFLIGLAFLAGYFMLIPGWAHYFSESKYLYIGLLIAFVALNCEENGKICLFFVILTAATAFVMIGAPFVMFGNRTAFFSDVFFIIALISCISRERKITYWMVCYALFGLSTLIFLIPSMFENYQNTQFVRRQVDEREKMLAIFKANNTQIFLQPLVKNEINSIVNPALLVYTPHLVVRDFSEKDMGKAYRIPSVTIRPFVGVWRDFQKFLNPHHIRSRFNVFVKDRSLFFVAEASCESMSNKKPFFAKIYPKNPHELNPTQLKNGFEELVFFWGANNKVTLISDDGHEKKNVCAFATHLPNYAIRKIVVG